jgi:hypothetical protein
MRVFAQIAPTRFFDSDPKMLGCLLDVGKSQLAIRVADVFDLIEAGQRIPDMRGIRQRLFALLGEGVSAIGKHFPVLGGQIPMFRMESPGWFYSHFSSLGEGNLLFVIYLGASPSSTLF